MPKYEALVKIESNINESLSEEEQQAHLWQAGDIVVVRPKGWSWGREEVKHFLIVELPDDMIEEEIQMLEDNVTIDYMDNNEDVGGESLEGNKVQDIIRRRRHKIDIDELLTFKSISHKDKEKIKEKIFDRDVEIQPFKDKSIKRSEIEDKTDSKELQDKIANKKSRMIIKGKKIKELPSNSFQGKKLRGRKSRNQE